MSLLVLLMALGATPAQATTIEFDVASLGGNTFRYDYTVENNSLGDVIEEFTIFFDLGLYENLVVPDAPADWDPIAIDPDGSLPDDGFYDALALGMGVDVGGSLGGFSVSFDWLGAGTPGSQVFNVIDPFTFATLDSGATSSSAPAPVPEPASLLLVASLLLLAGLARKRVMT